MITRQQRFWDGHTERLTFTHQGDECKGVATVLSHIGTCSPVALCLSRGHVLVLDFYSQQKAYFIIAFSALSIMLVSAKKVERN